MNTRVRIVGVGHCCWDTVCTIEQYPPEDGSTHILFIDDSHGGGGMATAMCQAAKLGIETGIIANLGTDKVGDQIIKEFSEFGIQTQLIRRITGGRSSTSFVMVNSRNGSRTKFPYHDELPDIEFDDAARTMIQEADVLHLDGTQWNNAMRAAKIAKEAGTLISLDASHIEKDDNEKNLELCRMADILITNAKYPMLVTGIKDQKKALLKLSDFGAKVTAFTDGNKGIYYISGGAVCHIPAFQVKTVDTTGAGDTFHGAFLAQWLECGNAEESFRFAAGAAALKCLKSGGRAGLSSRETVENFINHLN